MKTQHGGRRQRERFVRCGLMIVSLFVLVRFGSAQPVFAQQALENPRPNSFHSGIETLFGWVCDAQSVQLLFDGTALLQTVYGVSRADTRSVCGDENNGFEALVNWNDLGPGGHTVAVCVDNVCGASIGVVVNTYGTSFLQGRAANIPVCTNQTQVANPPFPAVTLLSWQESTQSFTIRLTATCREIDEICLDPNQQTLCDLLIPCCF
ncbi:MAG: hypothetical protein AB7G75_29320 [Candidatus Binatia bacterium]